ncbi:tannase and feruloyl esterase [Colletotrichum karsti]|uniref:Carboxylic ester hydrolase n=1 Tax=Colletotrichum karsti TaxID=1095194 RepID=A0A9P6HXL0_9PEZI|nr:tannase and feruloyl esterase [Colletotrichum karsti]KAF9873087.1 tannase and feruloyl esterase [Colletotrichum karsti]
MRVSHPLALQGFSSFGAVHGLTAEDCSSLASRLNLPDSTIHETTFISAGTNISLPDNHPSCAIPYQVSDVNICRVVFLTTTGPTSNISLEAWLPLEWSGRFLGTGNGGMNGCIKYGDLNYGATHQFATIGTNNGHDGISGAPFLNNPGVIEDYVYRAVHLEAELGKAIAEEFYGKKHTKSYYLGCSTGGRQGFKEAQTFPEDFDGIVAGAPAFDLISLMYWTGQLFIKTGSNETSRFLTPAQWELVNADILKQCDGLDGLEDGILEDPSLCQYRPEGLICSEGQTDCLTGEQAATVRAIFSPVYGLDGQFIYPRLQPGSNATERLLNGQPHQYPSDWWRYVVYNDTEWDPATLGPQDYAVASKQNPWNVATWEGDLSAAKERGVKILHYHGLQDNAISSDNSERYYDYVSRTMSLSSTELDEFYRYFRISGMAHCRGGTGASMIGGNPESFASYHSDANVLAAIVRWVEEGVAPDYILGSRLTASGEVDLQRKHCKYPARNVFTGKGDPANADSWQCV